MGKRESELPGRRVKDPTTAEEFAALKPGDVISEAASLGIGIKGLMYPFFIAVNKDDSRLLEQHLREAKFRANIAQINAQDIGPLFSAKQVALAVKTAFLVGAEQHSLAKRFTPDSLTRIVALAGLSEQQGKALYHELS